MAKFITVTKVNIGSSEVHAVNVDHILHFTLTGGEGSSRISFVNGESMWVSETAEQLKELVEEVKVLRNNDGEDEV